MHAVRPHWDAVARLGRYAPLVALFLSSYAVPAWAQRDTASDEVVLRYTPRTDTPVRYSYSFSARFEPEGGPGGGPGGGGPGGGGRGGPGGGGPGGDGPGGGGPGGGGPGGSPKVAVDVCVQPERIEDDGRVTLRIDVMPEPASAAGPRLPANSSVRGVMTPLRQLAEVSVDEPAQERPQGGPGGPGDAFAVDGLLSIVGSLLLPREPVTVGAKWSGVSEVPSPSGGDPTKVGTGSELVDRVLDGDRPVSVIYTELQVPVRFTGRSGPQSASGNMGIALMLEVFEDTGDIRTLTTVRAQGSMKAGELKVRIRDIAVSLLQHDAEGGTLTPLPRRPAR